ncbi:MAG: hypothetical protein GXO54_06120 [Chloroflexi bacterium]|nr:hypothetical protein [Chloroflexota bacterium]
MPTIRTHILLWLSLTLMGISLGCHGLTPSNPAPTIDLAGTAAALAAQTIAAATLNAAPTTSSPPTPPSPISPTAAVLTSPTAVPSPTRTATAPPSTAFGVATGQVYCRQGPGSWYPVVRVVHAGERLQIQGRAAVDTVLFLRVQPEGADEACWVLARYIRTDLETISALPELPTPVAPAGAFSLYYLGEYRCGSAAVGVTFNLINRGPEPIESGQVTVIHEGGEQTVRFDTRFRWATDCQRQGHYDRLLPGEMAPLTVFDLARGQGALRVRARMCTQDYLQGACTEREFIVP